MCCYWLLEFAILAAFFSSWRLTNIKGSQAPGLCKNQCPLKFLFNTLHQHVTINCWFGQLEGVWHLPVSRWDSRDWDHPGPALPQLSALWASEVLSERRVCCGPWGSVPLVGSPELSPRGDTKDLQPCCPPWPHPPYTFSFSRDLLQKALPLLFASRVWYRILPPVLWADRIPRWLPCQKPRCVLSSWLHQEGCPAGARLLGPEWHLHLLVESRTQAWQAVCVQLAFKGCFKGWSSKPQVVSL